MRALTIALPDAWTRWGPDSAAPAGHVTLTGLREINTPVYLIRGTDPWGGELLGVVLVHPDGSPRQATAYRADGSCLGFDGDLRAALHRLAGVCPTCTGTGGDHQIGCRDAGHRCDNCDGIDPGSCLFNVR